MEKRFNLETSILTDDLLFPEGPIYLNDGSILLVDLVSTSAVGRYVEWSEKVQPRWLAPKDE